MPLDPETLDFQRDARGRIARQSSARRAFLRTTPCPATGKPEPRCPGHTVDHIRPLKRGGADAPHNLQFQSADDARAKDRDE